MKFPVMIALLVALLLVGCGTDMGQMNSPADSMEKMIQSAGNAVETSALMQPTESTAPLTKEQAQAIALEHAGFTADQVTGLRTEYEIDDGIPRFEVKFRQDRWEYDYEINANTGAILSYDRDD